MPAKKKVKKSTKKTSKVKLVKKVVKKKVVKKKVAKKKVVKKKVVKKKVVKKKVVKKKVVKKKAATKVESKPIKKAVKKAAVKKKVTKKKVKKKVINYDEFKPDISASTSAGPLEFDPYSVDAREEYMNDTQVEHFRKILINWRTQLMSEVDTTVVHLQQDAEAYADPLDRAAQEEGFNLELRTRDRERKLIKKIEQALDWIDEGVYGYCEDCGSEIGVRRLEARPTAAKCIDCKTYSEIREKQIGN